MNTAQIVEQVKEVIMKELLTDIDDKYCVLDLCIENGSCQPLSKVSQVFLNEKKIELTKEYNSGQILFFRKYSYEKILIQYLENKYNVDDMEFDLFPSHKRKRELQEKQKRELEEKQCRDFEENIIKQIPYMKWEKTVRVSNTIYTAVDNVGRKIELHYNHGNIGKNKKANKLIYNHVPLKYAEYDVKLVVESIEKTHQKNVKADHIIVDTNTNQQKNKQKLKKSSAQRENEIKQNLGALNKQIYIGKIQKISNDYKIDINSVKEIIRQSQTKCSYYRNGNCMYLKQKCAPYQKQCIDYYRFISKILEKSKEQNVVKNSQIKGHKQNADNLRQQKMIPEIGLKDFVVRANVFKCMHNKHKIDNVVAMINIDDNGKRKQIEISAGYCSQCKIYFIIDATYQNLKKKGMVLCRVTDEKNYMKSGYINGMKLAQESLLMQYGYNVSQTEGLTATGRQKILAVIIDNKIMSKSEIISYIDFFISQRSSNSRMEVAISKWEADREFVENYKIGQYTQYGVTAIYRR